MPVGVTKISVWSNNSLLEQSFIEQKNFSDLKFEPYRDSSSLPYALVIIDISQDLSNISQKVISLYDHARTKNQKLAVLLLHPDTVDSEKNIYFAELLEKLSAGSPLHRIVCTKDLIVQGLPSTETLLEKYLINAVVSRKITISVKGNKIYYPLTFQDLVIALKKIFFLSGTAGQTFWLLGEPFSDLELSYLIKKNLEDSEGPDFEIDANVHFDDHNQDLNSLGNKTRALLNWEPRDEFPDYLKETVKLVGNDRSVMLTQIHQEQKQFRRSKWAKLAQSIVLTTDKISAYMPKKGIKKNIENSKDILIKFVESTIALVLLAFLCLSVIFIGFTSSSLKLLESTLGNIRRGDINTSVKRLNKSVLYLKIGEGSYSFVAPLIEFVASDFHEKNYNLFVFMHYAQSSLGNLQQTYQLAENIYQSIGTTSSGQFYEDASLALRSNLGQIYENLNQISLLTGSGMLPQVLEEKLRASDEFKNLSLINQQITEILKTAEIIPAFLGGDSAKNIVVLFQNTNELRSTGGVIDYLLVLVLDQGRVVSRKIYRGDELDSLAVGAAVAPPLIRLYSGSDDWKVRDLNYNPDFPQTAANISWFIDKVLKIKPDVVLGTTDKLISGFIQENRGIVLDGQNVTSESFQAELLTVSPSLLYRKLIDYYLDQIFSHKLSILSFGRVIANQSEGNHLLFWTADNQLEKSISSQAFSGSVIPRSCHGGLSGSRCLSQTTYFNESNHSLIPLSTKIQRKIVHKVQLEVNQVRHEYLATYQFLENIPNLNRNLNQVIQLYAPKGSALEQVTLDGKDLSLRGISQSTDNGLERFQIPISLTINENHELTLKFISPVSTPNLLPFAYSLTEFHQPGVSAPDTELILNFPENARPAAITAPVTSGPNSFSLNLPAKTTVFGVSFVPSDR